MNRIGSLIAASFAAMVYFLPMIAVSQSVGPLDKIQTVFSKGNADGLESILNDEVEIGWEGKKNKYSKGKAAIWIKEFLKIILRLLLNMCIKALQKMEYNMP